ncbi:MAG TPA: ThuA domain-containing protein [Clostridia bacterium]|nr:ThuA domain-containing protein [Clostridia bacterium]
MRKAIGIASLVALVGSVLFAPVTALAAPPTDKPEYRIFVFTRGAPTAYASAAVKTIKEIGKAEGFTVQSNGDPTQFTAENLGRYRAVVLLANAGDALTAEQEAAFEDYYTNGGGVVAIHSAIETEPDWSFLTEVLGARGAGQTAAQPGTIKVADRVHEASRDLPEYWNRTEAWYNFSANVRGFSHVLATVTEDPYDAHPDGLVTGISGGTMGFDHPIAWCKDFRGGRSFYTGLGTTAGAFSDPSYRTHLRGALLWTAGVADPVYSDCGATVLANYEQTVISAPPNLSEPIGFDVLPDGRVIQTDRRGGVRLHDGVANTTTLIAQLPVYTHSEDGMYGPAVDNDFAENRWVYLFYAPLTMTTDPGDEYTYPESTPAGNAPTTGADPSVWDPWIGYFQLSRFKFVDASGDTPAHLDLATEQRILKVPVNRGACCHVAGDITFDSDNNLWLVTGDDTPAGGGNSGGFSPHNDMITTTGLYNAPHVDARRSALNTNDLRGKILRITVQADGSYTIPPGNLFTGAEEGGGKTRPEIYAMGFRNPFRITLDADDVAYITDYSPDSNTPTNFRGPAGTGRMMKVDEPANYGWPLCYQPDLPYYRWNFNTTQPLDSPAQAHECDNPTRGPANTSRWNTGLEFSPPIKRSELWYSFTPENRAVNPLGTPCFEYYNGSGATACPQRFPELLTGGVGPHGAAKYDYDPDLASDTKFPPYYDGAIFFGEFTRDYLREIRLDADGNVFKINNLLNCGPTPTNVNRPFVCDNPMDMRWSFDDGHFYLLTYGDGFFNINPDAAMTKFSYVKGTRAPVVFLDASPTNGPAPLTVQFSSAGTHDPDPADSITFSWDFDGDGVADSMDPNPSFTYTAIGQYTARLTVTDSSGKSTQANTVITVGNTAPTVVINAPVDGGLFAFGQSIPWSVTVTDPEEGPIDCNRIEVTWVLGHDEHGHAGETQTGCSGVLETFADDASHGGNVFGVISASYQDLGGPGGVPALTTVTQHQIRQKHQEVEFVTQQSGTNTATTSDVGGGQHRGSLSNNDWLRLNGPFNLLNIDSLTFRVASTGTAVPAGNPLAAVEVRLDAVDGPLLLTANLTSTGNATTWESQTFALADPGGAHDVFLVIRSVPGGATGNNLFNLNWVEFGGTGVAAP